MRTQPLEIFHRHHNNPILTAANWHYPVNTVFNPGAVLLQDGSTLLLCRVEDYRGHSHLCAARSVNGVDSWKIDLVPTFSPDFDNFPEELWGVEDPRITYIPELEKYAIVYTAYSDIGPGVALAFTKDFVEFERMGMIMPPEDKDAALLPRRINGRWALIHRPIGGVRLHGSTDPKTRRTRRADDTSNAHMWISYSDDLKNWDGHTRLLDARLGAWWDANKIGLSPPLIETPDGWLAIYHGVKQNAAGCIYRLGLALFDLEQPEVCIKRGNEWVFGPREEYELHGDVDKVVFPCGYTLAPDGDTLRIYYGAADTSIAMATASVKVMLDWLKRQD